MKAYPVCLKLEGYPCLVVGGGKVACRKAKSLLACGAKVTVASPALCRGFAKLRKENKIFFKKSEYREKFLRGFFLVIAATNDEKVNLKIQKAAKSKKILFNIVDKPALCNFYVPAVIRKKGLLVSVSTAGRFPGLAKKLKEDLTPILANYADKIKILTRLRDQIKLRVKSPKARKKLAKILLHRRVLNLIERKKMRSFNDFKKYGDLKK